MYAAMTAYCDTDEEVICIEPYFDQYFAGVHFQNAKPIFVPLHPPQGEGVKDGANWKLDIDEFRAAFTDKTKMVIINTPHNPVGKVFTRDELTQISKVRCSANQRGLTTDAW